MAAIVGFSPAYPTMAVSTTSIVSMDATSQMESLPAYTFIGRSDSASFTLP